MVIIPVRRGNDSKGSFYRWGDSGKKYYYTTNNEESRKKQYEKQRKQGVQIKINESVRKILNIK